MKRRLFLIVLTSVLLVLSLPAFLAYWLAYTESGLQFLAGQTSRLKTVQIRIEGLHGRLVGPWSATRIEIEHERVRIVATDLKSEVVLPGVLLQTLHLNNVRVGQVDIALKPRVSPPNNRKPRFLPAWLQLRVDNFLVGPVKLTLLNGQTLIARATRGEMQMDNNTMELHGLRLQADEFECSGSGELRAATPFGVGGSLRCNAQLAQQPRYAAQFKLSGDLNRLDVTGSLLEPLAANFSGAGLDLTTAWHWELQAVAPAANLKPWAPDSKLQNFALNVTASGAARGLKAQGQLKLSTGPVGPVDFNVLGAYADKRFSADRLELSFAGYPGRVIADGTMIFDGGPPTMQLKGHWSKLQWPLEKPVAGSSRGEFTLSGPMPYDYTVKTQFSMANSGALQADGTGQIDTEAMSFKQLEVRTVQNKGLPAVVQGSGKVAWGGAQEWQIKAAAKQIDPARFHPAFPGAVAFKVNASGRGFAPSGPWSIQLSELSGRLRAQTIAGQARVSRDGKRWQIDDSLLQFGNARLQASGHYDDAPDIQWQLSATDLAQVFPEARGSIDFRGTLKGSADRPELTSSLQGSKLKYLDYSIAEVRGQADLDLTNKQKSSLKLNATEVGIGPRQLKRVQLTASGTGNAHTIQLDANASNLQLQLAASGGYAPRRWQGAVNTLRVTAADTTLNLQAALPLYLSAERIEAGDFCLVGGAERVCGNGRWQNGGPWAAALKVTALPLRLFAAGLPRQAQYAGMLGVDAQASGKPGEAWTGTAQLNFTDGKLFYMRADGKQEQMSIGSGRAQLNAEAARLRATVQLSAGEPAEMDASATAERNGKDWKRFPLSGTLRARTRELGFVPILVPEVDRASGELSAQMDVDGTLGAPRFSGSFGIDKGEMDLYAVNLLLRDIGAKVQLSGNSLQLNAQLRAGEGKAQVDGKLSWTDGAPKGTLDFKGDDLVVANVPEARVHASPNISVTIDGRHIEVDGAVRVPYARLAPANLTGAVLPSEDEVIAGEAPIDPNKRFSVNTGIHLILGKDVRMDSYGLSGKLTGGIVVYTATDEPSTGTGELKIEEGKYKAYGRELNIERGRLVFTGGLLSIPGVDIRATRKFPEVLAGINVRGDLRNPRVTFFSEPPLPQTQIASLLVAGQTFDSLQSGVGQNSGQTRDQLIAQGGALLAKQLGTQIGIDEVSVESGANANTSLVLGKYLSPRLYVGYGISLAETINTLKLRYTLGDRWTIKMEAGENRSADVVYTIDR